MNFMPMETLIDIFQGLTDLLDDWLIKQWMLLIHDKLKELLILFFDKLKKANESIYTEGWRMSA